MGAMKIASDQVDTVCMECFRVIEQRALITCPSCDGKTQYVPKGTGQETARTFKKLGRNRIIE